jgi:hypothetical protein
LQILLLFGEFRLLGSGTKVTTYPEGSHPTDASEQTDGVNAGGAMATLWKEDDRDVGADDWTIGVAREICCTPRDAVRYGPIPKGGQKLPVSAFGASG